MLELEGRQLGNYDVIRRIRMGGMGAVYEGRQRTAFDRRVAIKVILGDYASDQDMRRRFVREARTIARLHHPHILPLIEYGDEQKLLYLVMPYIEGGTLTSYLRRSLPDLNKVSAIYQQLLDEVEVIKMQLSAPIPSPCDHDASIPLELGEVVSIAMAKRMEDRFASVAELRQAFLAAIQGPPITLDDDGSIGDIYSFSAGPISTPLLPPEPPTPTPALEQRRVKPPVPLTPAVDTYGHVRQRTTDTSKNNRQRTTEPVQQHRRRFVLSVIAATSVPMLLLVLLLVPRLLGIALLPVGVP